MGNRLFALMALCFGILAAASVVPYTSRDSVRAAQSPATPLATAQPQTIIPLPPAWEEQPEQLLARIQALEKQLSADEIKIASLSRDVEKLKHHTHPYDSFHSTVPEGWLTLTAFSESSTGMFEKVCRFGITYCDHAGSWEIPVFNNFTPPKWEYMSSATGEPVYH